MRIAYGTSGGRRDAYARNGRANPAFSATCFRRGKLEVSQSIEGALASMYNIPSISNVMQENDSLSYVHTIQHLELQDFSDAIPYNAPIKHITVTLGPSLDKQIIKTIAMFDTGCTSCIIDASCIKAQASLEAFTISKPSKKNEYANLASEKAKIHILGTTIAYFTFTDEHGCQMPFRTTILITSGLRHPMYIGANIMQSPHYEAATPTGLKFKPTFPLLKTIHRGTHHIPFLSRQQVDEYLNCKGACVLTDSVTLLPNANIVAKCKVDTHSLLPHTPLVDVQEHAQFNYVSILPAAYEITPEKRINIILTNLTPTTQFIPAGTNIAEATIFSANEASSMEICSHITHMENEGKHTLNFLGGTSYSNIHAFNEIAINDEFSMFKEEIPYTHKEDGIIQIPITDYYDKLESSRTMSMPTTKPLHEDYLDEFDTTHLSENEKDKLRPLINSYIDCFARDISEVGTCKLLKLTADLREPKEDKLSIKASLKQAAVDS